MLSSISHHGEWKREKAPKWTKFLSFLRECERENEEKENILQNDIDFFWSFFFYRLTSWNKQKAEIKMCTHSNRKRKAFGFCMLSFRSPLVWIILNKMLNTSPTLSYDLFFPPRIKVLFFPLILYCVKFWAQRTSTSHTS